MLPKLEVRSSTPGSQRCPCINTDLSWDALIPFWSLGVRNLSCPSSIVSLLWHPGPLAAPGGRLRPSIISVCPPRPSRNHSAPPGLCWARGTCLSQLHSWVLHLPGLHSPLSFPARATHWGNCYSTPTSGFSAEAVRRQSAISDHCIWALQTSFLTT